MLLQVALVAAEGLLLFVLSRALFGWVLQAFASRNSRRRGGWLLQLIRLPGNLVHELSHALAFLVTGYTVKRVVPCLWDRSGAGVCQPGRPWSPIAVPWLATGLAALAPLFTGAVALYAVAHLLDVPLEAHLSLREPGRSVLHSIYGSLLLLDYSSWRTWLFLYLAFTIGAELAPSRTDLALGIPALLALGLATTLFLLATYQLDPEAPFRVVVLTNAYQGLTALARLLGIALVTTALVTALTFLPAALIRAARG